MKKLIACLAALALVGCGSVAPGVEKTILYRPSFDSQIGDVVGLQWNGMTFVYVVGQGVSMPLTPSTVTKPVVAEK